jgi:glycosyltransferase involved in cell wall biosynthesis/SAM-dependent methyltransferase
MGAISPIPDDLSLFYGDNYYGIGGQNLSSVGYSDYSYTAEHGVSWAAALVKLLRPDGGRVLDVGCADGHLLAKLGPNYAVFGIEANEAAGRIATQHGVAVLGRDLLDAGIIRHYTHSFDVITAIAVFEHLRDIRSGLENVLHLLRDDGVLLFEVPLVSTTHDNTVWFNSSLEHVWYPSEQGLKWLVQTELEVQLLGVELHIKNYGSNYVGLIFRKTADERTLRGIASRVLLREAEPVSTEEAAARMMLHLVHAATTTIADVDALATLPFAAVNPQLLRRLAELWSADLWRQDFLRVEAEQAQMRARGLQADLETAESDRLRSHLELAVVTEAEQKAIERQIALEAELAEVQARAVRLQADLGVAEADRTRSHLELTTALLSAEAQLAVAQSDLAALSRARTTLAREREILNREQAALNIAQAALTEAERQFIGRQAACETEFAALHSSGAWRVAMILREAARRYSWVARPARRIARVLWWTLRGRLIGQLRFRRKVRAQLRTELDVPTAPSPLQTVESLPEDLSEAMPSPLGRDLVILKETGHRPRLIAEPERQGVWPLVSVVIVSFNYGQFVTAAVDSVLNQTFKDLEVIVVEGGSSNPESRAIVAGLRRPRTRILMQGRGHFTGANRNFGISQARGQYVCCLDADDTLAPTYIEKAVFLLERHGYDVVSSAIELVGEGQGQISIMEQPDLGALLDDNQVVTTAVFRRSLWEQAGGYRDVDRRVSGYVYEDWAFWIRLAALGARFINLHHDPLLHYRVRAGSLSRSNDVLSPERQRHAVRLMNRDLLGSVTASIARSRRLASVRYGTPCAAPAPIILDQARPMPGAPTLLLAMPFLILGGAERLLSAVVAHLVQKGWRIVVTTSIEPGPEHGDTASWFKPYTEEIFCLPRFLPSELWEDFLHHLVRSRSIDIVWVVGCAFTYDCLRGLRAAHPDLRVADLLFNTVGHAANNRRRRDLIDVIFVENKEVHAWLLTRGEDAARIRLVESGVDVATLRPCARSDILTQEIGATADDLIVGFSGRWSEEKNPLGFVQIAKLVDPALPVRFVMTGAGHLGPTIERALQEGCFPDGRFHLLGEVPEIAPVLASFDVLVVPSVLDGRPTVVLEALALGVPVLASRVGALPELIQDGSTGWLLEPNDAAAFAACIEHAHRNRDNLLNMRRNARAYAEARLDAQHMLTAYRTELETLLPKDRRLD